METDGVSPSAFERFLCFLEKTKKGLSGKMRAKTNVPGCKFRHQDHMLGGNMINSGKN